MKHSSGPLEIAEHVIDGMRVSIEWSNESGVYRAQFLERDRYIMFDLGPREPQYQDVMEKAEIARTSFDVIWASEKGRKVQ